LIYRFSFVLIIGSLFTGTAQCMYLVSMFILVVVSCVGRRRDDKVTHTKGHKDVGQYKMY